tara:strand:- start:998 stop:1363 length:366 start_codon:yes stop_codon:yes gene_type:complete
MSVHKVNHTRSTIADTIINEMTDDDNPDMEVKLKGYHHGGKGFRLIVNNVTKLNEITQDLWKNIISNKGLESEIEADMMNGKVSIDCKPVGKRQRNLKCNYSAMYLSISLILIYILWSRHM